MRSRLMASAESALLAQLVAKRTAKCKEHCIAACHARGWHRSRLLPVRLLAKCFDYVPRFLTRLCAFNRHTRPCRRNDKPAKTRFMLWRLDVGDTTYFPIHGTLLSPSCITRSGRGKSQILSSAGITPPSDTELL